MLNDSIADFFCFYASLRKEETEQKRQPNYNGNSAGRDNTCKGKFKPG